MTIKVFIGADPNGCDIESQIVCEYSMRKNSSSDIDIEWMTLSNDPDSFWYSNQTGGGWNTSKFATPFSGFRWGIPARCNYQGKAIYMDSDMIIMSDIKKLWDQKFDPGKVIISKGPSFPDRYCVCVWNNEEAQKYLPDINEIKKSDILYNQVKNFFASRQDLIQPFDGNWNCIDGEDLPVEEIDIFHFSSMEHQFCHPHAAKRLKEENRQHWYTGNVSEHWRKDFQKIFDDLLIEAQDNGYTIERYRPKTYYGPFKKEYQSFNGNAHQFVKRVTP